MWVVLLNIALRTMLLTMPLWGEQVCRFESYCVHFATIIITHNNLNKTNLDYIHHNENDRKVNCIVNQRE